MALRIINVTDVYKLDNFPSLKTLIEEKTKEMEQKYPQSQTVSILTGDFLAPYLLSSVDKGIGMTRMLNETPIDYVIFGNHEDDLEHEYVCKRISDYQGTWINTNMQDHEQMKDQRPYAIITLDVPNKKATRSVGLIGVLSDSASLYRKNCFNGATIKDPYDTIEEYKEKLEKECGVDLVIPLCHLYVPQDKVTCERFDFPVILSGHDHHVVDEVFFGTRLLKAGADAEHAVILDIVFDDEGKPNIDVEIVKVRDWEENSSLREIVDKSMSVLSKLEHTEICRVPEKYRPLDSIDARSRVCTAGHFLFSQLKDALNSGDKDRPTVDAVFISGGNVRGGKMYEQDAKFTLKDLKDEMQETLEAVIVEVPGEVIAKGVKATHGESNPGFMQFDGDVELDEEGMVKTIDGKPIDMEKTYRIATTLWDIQDGPSEPLTGYFKAHPDLLPDAEFPIMSTLLSHFAKFVWRQVFESLDTNQDGVLSKEELKAIDTDDDGRISKSELAAHMKTLGWDVDEEELSFIDCIFEAAGDANKDGYLSGDELNVS